MTRGLVAVLVLIVGACAGTPAPSSDRAAQVSTAVRDLHEGQVVDGVPCLRDDLPQHHQHIHLVILWNGRGVTVPGGIGVGRPWGLGSDGFLSTGACFAWIHTHDTSGVVHVFTQVGKSDTLGQIFAVWGQPFDANGALGVDAPVRVLANGMRLDGDPSAAPLTNFENIVVEIGTPPTAPPSALYDFGTMRR